ncbi:MAG: CaiB/BaiF CoA transferase family protein [Mycobacterium sp.]
MPSPAQSPSADNHLPLSGVRVLDVTDGPAGKATRFLGDLGADVILVEPPSGVASRKAQPHCGSSSYEFVTTHWNKRSVALDLADPVDRDEFLRLSDTADVVVESLSPGALAEFGLGPAALRKRNPSLVVASVTAFGQRGPYRDWRGPEAVVIAQSSALTRSGAPGREPLAPPGPFAQETAAVQAAYCILLAYFRSLHSGDGDYVDCSLFDMSVQGLDPGYGMAGSATAGRPLRDLPLGRPDVTMRYPIIACADGFVRICMLAPKHWRAMFDWLGQPAEFADPALERIGPRYAAWDRIKPRIAELFATRSRAELLSEAVRRGVPMAALNSPQEILASDHVRERGSFHSVEVCDDATGAVPSGYLEIDGRRAGFRHRAPSLSAHRIDWSARPESVPARIVEGLSQSRRPLAGLRVLDLGVIVVGGDTGRLLADQGADVIKVENRAFPDGARQGDRDDTVSPGFAVGNRGKRSIEINLRDPAGLDVFHQLVRTSDVVLSNFKPGTTESLGLDQDTLRRINPAVVIVESSALGNTGPWGDRMGYGPLVRATVGLTGLWRHADSAEGFGDDATVYPDHAAARVAVTAIVAALIDRWSTGAGCYIAIAQMETVFMQLAAQYLRESREPGTLVTRDGLSEFDYPADVFECLGEDAYCVIVVDGDQDWHKLTSAIGHAELATNLDYASARDRLTHRDDIRTLISAWTRDRSPAEAAGLLQAAGVAAGAGIHIRDLGEDPHLIAREQFATLPQPGISEPLFTETGPGLFEGIEAPTLAPAPLLGEHTRAVCREVLDFSDRQIDELISAGVLFEHPASTTAAGG